MKLFQAADTVALTGLTKSQLREWTGRGRRALLPPDIEPDGPGRHALFSWQSILVLRVLLALHSDFAAELGAWAPAAKHLREQLGHAPFPSLWRVSAVFPNRETALLLETTSNVKNNVVIIPLEPHLTVIATKLSLPRPDQLPLFPPMVIGR